MTRKLIAPDVVEKILHVAEERLGLLPPPGTSHPRVMDRLLEELRRGSDSLGLGDMLRAMDGNDSSLQLVARILTVGETYFFRHPPQLKRLEVAVLPEILQSGPPRELLVWSAGCSTGEEAYTLALLLGEWMKDRPGWRFQVLGTDINARSLDIAREGIYTAWSFRSAPEELVDRGFEREGEFYRVRDEWRERVRFEVFNLAHPAALPSPLLAGPPDIIVCRNVLIYFSSQVIGQVLKFFDSQLGENGWLLVGPSESPSVPRLSRFRAADRETAGFFRTRPMPAPSVFTPRVGQMSHGASLLTAALRPLPAESGPAAPGAPVTAPDDGAEEPAPVLTRGLPSTDGEMEAVPRPQTRSPRDVLGQAWELANRGSSREALETLEEVIGIPGPLPECFLLKGLLEKELGRSSDARESFRKALFLDWNLIPAHYHLARMASTEGQARTVRRHVRALRTLLAGLEPEAGIPHMEGLSPARIGSLLDRLEGGTGEERDEG